MNYKNMLKHAGMLCEYDDLTRDTSNDYAILDELKKLKDTYLGDDFYWWDGTSDGKTSKDEPLGYWDGRDGTSHYYIRTRYGTQFSIVVDTKQNIIIRVFLGNKCYATYNSIDEFEEYLKKRNNARKQKKSISEYDEDQDEWISGAHENESTKIKNKNMTINEAKQVLNRTGYKLIKENAGNNIDLTVYIYDDGYRPPKDEIEDNDPAKDWIDFLDWEVRAGHCYETKYNINDNNINETFKRICKSMKYHYGYSYLNGSVRGTINGKEIYESISACDVIHDLKNIFKQNGIEVEFNEET